MAHTRKVTLLVTVASTWLLGGLVASADDGRCTHPWASQAALKAAFHCVGNLRQASKPTVLLVHGTYGRPDGWDWNYVPALRAEGWPVCTVALPDRGTASIPVSAEYIEYAIRTAFRMSGRKVEVIGHSQGGMSPRWVLRFAPETRAMVDDFIALAASNHGALVPFFFCDAGPSPDPWGTVGCPPALWQQRVESHFLTRLNEDSEVVPEVDYTSIYTVLDSVIGFDDGPRPSSAIRSTRANVANISVQQACPANTADHFEMGTIDPVAYAIVLDALEHRGPASLERLLQGAAPGSPAFCAAVFMPGVNPRTFEDNWNRELGDVFAAIQTARNVASEPALPCSSRRRAGIQD